MCAASRKDRFETAACLLNNGANPLLIDDSKIFYELSTAQVMNAYKPLLMIARFIIGVTNEKTLKNEIGNYNPRVPKAYVNVLKKLQTKYEIFRTLKPSLKEQFVPYLSKMFAIESSEKVEQIISLAKELHDKKVSNAAESAYNAVIITPKNINDMVKPVTATLVINHRAKIEPSIAASKIEHTKKTSNLNCVIC
ncbi:MAG: hypothetical protein J0H68_01365 [Sphingobacteriia bacterium]|nr:hypothetical protein [Sphingobacteriia bacterium]